MLHLEKKIQKFSPQRGLAKMFWRPARMFPWAPLWLSTGLALAMPLPHPSSSFFWICQWLSPERHHHQLQFSHHLLTDHHRKSIENINDCHRNRSKSARCPRHAFHAPITPFVFCRGVNDLWETNCICFSYSFLYIITGEMQWYDLAASVLYSSSCSIT